jgi:SAM-dependent methyltransferase
MKSDVKIREHWDQVAKSWRESSVDRLWREHADQVNAHLVERWLPYVSGGRLLKTDLFDEAATGGLSPSLRDRADLVVGIDLSALTAGEARCHSQKMVVACADVRFLPFADGTFDAVLSNSTLDHFSTRDDLVAGIRELHRVTRPGGELILTLDNGANPIVALRNMMPFEWLQRLRIVPYFMGVTCGPLGLRRLLEEANWKLLELTAILHCPRFLMVRAARVFGRRASTRVQRGFLAWLIGFESLELWPTRYLTGYFVAAKAMRSKDVGRGAL